MEKRNDPPWGNGFQHKLKPSEEKPNAHNFDHLFEGLQVTREERVEPSSHKQKPINMDEASSNPFDTPPTPASEAPASTNKTRTRTLCSSFVEIVLRLIVVILLLLAFFLIATDSKIVKVLSLFGQVKLKISYFQSFKYLLTVSMMVLGISLIQLIPETYRMKTGEVLIPEEIILYFNFVSDQVVAYLLLSSTSAGMTASELMRNGYDTVWMSLCNKTGFWGVCAQAAASVSMAFFAFLIMASLALLSGYRLAKYLVFA